MEAKDIQIKLVTESGEFVDAIQKVDFLCLLKSAIRHIEEIGGHDPNTDDIDALVGPRSTYTVDETRRRLETIAQIYARHANALLAAKRVSESLAQPTVPESELPF